MLKQNNLFMGVALLLLVLLSGCSQSDGYSTSEVASKEEPVVIHGYTLPPEPDPVINNSTLLGIDSNNNGVRDDVEIWILKKYKDKHPIYTEIAMQAGRAWQKVLEDPSKAKETSKILHAAQYCQFYFQYDAKRFGKPILVTTSIINRTFRKKVTNTEEREDAYWEYDTLLSGSIGTLPRAAKEKEFCDFNITQFH